MTAHRVTLTVVAGLLAIASGTHLAWLSVSASAQTKRDSVWGQPTLWGDPDLQGE